jgi:DNA-binding NarL/FixJ family response regulator
MRGRTLRTIAVCSGHRVLVAGFRAAVAEPAGLELVEFSSTVEMLASRRPTDMALIDIDLVTSQQELSKIRSAAPATGMILWADWITPEFAREAIAVGLRGILRKDASIDLYLRCFENVAAGELWLESELSDKLHLTKAVRLSPRERQLVTLLTEGLRNKEIAGRMNITEGTAKTYLSRLFEKTGASDRFELAIFALKNFEAYPSAGPSRGPRIFAPLRDVFSRRA